ncbi:MAG TPA: hypothetical protein PKX15_10250 [Bacteroidales bacterium]|nr:hypothetical protein [Bacteroidales bacterium]
MKTHIKIVIFIAISLGMMQCKEKEPEPEPIIKKPVDYRDKWCGNYLCLKKQTSCSIDTACSTIESTEMINVSKVKDSLIKILNVTVKFNLGTKNFGGSDYPDPESNYRVFQGHFSGDSIYISTYQGGLGFGTSCSYQGEKQ